MNKPCQFRVRPPQVAWLLLGFGVALRVGLYGWPSPPRATVVMAAGVIAAGLSLMLWAWWQFKRSGTPVCHRHEPLKLVTSGAFRYSRNPMYLGLLLMLAGAGIGVGRWPMFLPAVGFILVMQFGFIPCEERWMAQIFGGEYLGYRARTRRWV